MEEKYQIEKQYKIVVTGPESTGKTELTQLLAAHYGGVVVPEFAREYVESLDGRYTYNDVVSIAEEQLRKRELTGFEPAGMFFFDTELIITKVWFEEVFNSCPEWLPKKVKEPFADFYLLCSPDIPWEDDPVRENGGEMREYLFNRYREELEENCFSYFIVSGKNEIRLRNAINGINKFLNDQGKILN